MLMMTVYLAQQQQKQKLTSIQNMSVTVTCNFVNMFDYLQVSVSVVVVPCETFSATAAAKVTTQSISECVVDHRSK